MKRSELRDGMPVRVNWPQGSELAVVFWNTKLNVFGLRFNEGGPVEVPEISSDLLEIVEPMDRGADEPDSNESESADWWYRLVHADVETCKEELLLMTTTDLPVLRLARQACERLHQTTRERFIKLRIKQLLAEMIES